MLFDRKNAPKKFSSAMLIFLSEFKRQFALVSLENVVIISRYVEKHLDNKHAVLRLLPKADVSLKMKKIFFCSDYIEFLW